MSGWIKLHRKILDWERYNDHNTSRLFIYILLNANHTDKKRQGIDIKKGTFITSFQSLARGTGLSIMQVRTGIKNLERSKNVTRKVTSKYQAISVCGWEIYQNDDENVTIKVTGKQQANNKQITTTKNDKNDKNENKTNNNIFIPPTVEEIKAYCEERKNNIDPEYFHMYYETNGRKVNDKPMKNRKLSVVTRENKNKEKEREKSIEPLEIGTKEHLAWYKKNMIGKPYKDPVMGYDAEYKPGHYRQYLCVAHGIKRPDTREYQQKAEGTREDFIF